MEKFTHISHRHFLMKLFYTVMLGGMQARE